MAVSDIKDRARIGPNAVLQHIPVLDAMIGERLRNALLYRAGVDEPPADAGMLAEEDVARLHHAVRLYLPSHAHDIQRKAGLATGDYILANRIPAAAQRVIRALPAALGARLLTLAIAKHAWTFAGSGRFHVLGYRPLRLEIHGNPLARGPATGPICAWHAAVFERLYAHLVWPNVSVTEESCVASGASACVFVLHPG
ncbi:MAG: bacteriochlorophyll 4-vinyl reductase [Roseinatronobacter sp.]